MTQRRTYGYSEKAGRWTIDLGHMNSTAPEELTHQADVATRIFLQSFADLCTVEDAEGDLAQLDDEGRLSALWGEVSLEHDKDGRFHPTPDGAPGNLSQRTFLSRVMLTCATKIEEHGEHQQVSFSDGIYFHYDSGLSSLVGEPAGFDSAYVSVSTEVDPWLDAPLHGGQFLDNRTTASINRPRLERALRSWEAAIGRPISQVDSNAYRSLVDRYGFRPGGQPDPA